MPGASPYPHRNTGPPNFCPARAALRASAPNAEQVSFEGPHLLLQARPEVTAAAIEAFLRRLQRSCDDT
jgi:hypothetical protein